jgi:hypothetical protein
MRFTSPNVKPALTPLGHRLLHLSESKLYNLELGSVDSGVALWKGVIVREAIKTAWKSVDQGAVVGDINDWNSKSAMGLDIIGEEDEEEEEVEAEYEYMGYSGGSTSSGSTSSGEQRWFDDLLSTLGDDEYYEQQRLNQQRHEWVESSVEALADEEYEYDYQDMEAYTLPSVSPTATTSSLPTPAAIREDVTVTVTAAFDPEEFEVDAEVEFESEDEEYLEYSPSAEYPIAQPLQPILTPLSSPVYHAPHTTPTSSPISPITPIAGYCDDLEECALDFLLPPPLYRSYSSDSASSDRSVCRTPATSCEDLEEMVVSDDDEVDSDAEGECQEDGDGERGVEEGFGKKQLDWLGLNALRARDPCWSWSDE